MLSAEERDQLLIRLDERVKDIKEDDIPAIKAGLKEHGKRIRRIELILAASGVLGGGTLGIIKLLGG